MAKTQVKFLQVKLNSNHFDEDSIAQGQINIKDDAIGADQLADTNVTAGQYGAADTVGTFEVDDQGRLIDAADALIDITHDQVNDFDAGVRDNRLDQMTTPTSNVSFGGVKIISLADGVNPADAINKSQLDEALSNAVNGIMWKEPVLAASTADLGATYNAGATPPRLELSSSALDLDGIQRIALNSRVLLKDQTDDTENGIWEVSQDGYASGDFSVGAIEIVQMNNLVAGTRGEVILSLSQTVQAAGPQIFLQDFQGNNHTFSFGSNAGEIPLAPGNTAADITQQRDDIAQAINGKLQAGLRVFAAQTTPAGVKIQFSEGPSIGNPAAPRTASVTAGVAGLSMSAANFANPIVGDTISFQANGGMGSVTFYDVIDSSNTVGQQIHLKAATDAFATEIASKLNGDSRLNSATVDPGNSSKVILEWFEKGSAQNGGPLNYNAAGAAVSPADFVITVWANGALADTHLIRASDMNEDEEFVSAAVLVEEGSTWEESGWICSSDEVLTVGTSDIEFIRFTGLGQVTAGVGISKSYNTLDLDIIRVDLTLGAANQNTFGLGVGFAQAAQMAAIMSHSLTQVFLNGVLLDPATGTNHIYGAGGNDDGDYFLHESNGSGLIELPAGVLADTGDKITIIHASQL